MRIMALDIGEVRCGIAISDPDERVASPVCVLPTNEVKANAASFRRVCQDWEPEMLVSGLPLSLTGEAGAQAQRCKEIALLVGKNLQLPVDFSDERLSSAEAKRVLRERGLSERDMRGKVDMIAASIFLQSWLDARISQK
ncbi:MAG: Holliday junction resolvase RuvX [Eggerthellaceae bacterium]